MRPLALVAALLVLGASACGGGTRTVTVTRTVSTTVTVRTTTTTPAPPSQAACAGAALAGSFAVIPGSAGAGQIGYRLRLTNTGSDPCWVSGIPAADLLDAQGAVLPTTVSPAHPDETAARVVLAPGGSASALARFSPDVPGPTEQGGGPCEPKAYRLRILIGGGSLEVPVTPPTPVCERGSLTLTNLAPA